ncbi:MAG: hypothetical protein HGB22_10860 [Chlorobiaceae bacterium]|nr:hypothetical protein [Chlorobiaceae bacterium]
MRTAFFTTAFMLMLVGCSNSETRISDDKLHSLVIGKSTQAEVLKSMGNPTSTTVNVSGNQTLLYSEEKRQKKQSGGESVKSRVVVLEIGPDGLLSGISTTDSSIETGSNAK